MKKILSLILSLMMVMGCACAETFFSIDTIVLEMNETEEIDLDGDGSTEKIQLFMDGMEDESYLRMNIEGSDGSISTYDTWIQSQQACFCIDMNGDGMQEILLSGDVQSDDYITHCLNYGSEYGIREFTFADANRGINTGEHLAEGYGKIVSIDGLYLTLRGSQDVLGTWMADRIFVLENNVFELADEGMWIMQDITGDESIWEYFCLNPIKEIPATFEDGSKGTLSIGEKFVITFSDKISIAGFVTQEGKKGFIDLTRNTKDGWGYMIDGIADYEYFEYIPYAD